MQQPKTYRYLQVDDYLDNALWRHFDQINDRLMVLFDLLRLEKQIQASYSHFL